MEQKENKVNPPKKRLSQSSSSLFAKPLSKPVPRVDIFKKSTTTSQANGKPAPAKPTPATTAENGFKTPLKAVQSSIKVIHSSVDLGSMKANIQEEMAALNIEKPLLDPKSQSAVKPTVNRNLLFTNKINTPQSANKAPTSFTNTFKYDPKCVTGIPWIKPKKTTIPKPFKFASDQLAAKRATSK